VQEIKTAWQDWIGKAIWALLTAEDRKIMKRAALQSGFTSLFHFPVTSFTTHPNAPKFQKASAYI